MEVAKQYLDSSSVHGMSYISSTRKLLKVFWVVVVLSGFTGAAILIYQSFQAWDESPVTTTVETLAISDLTLPKITVCPPKNTYTNLNYDLIMAENMTLDNDTRKYLKDSATEAALDYVFQEFMSNITMFEEDNRYYNWYHGYSKISMPHYAADKLQFTIDTSATLGTVTTKYFGTSFQPEDILTHLMFYLNIKVPSRVANSNNHSMNFEIQKVSMENLYDDEKDQIKLDNTMLKGPKDIHYYRKNFTPPSSDHSVSLNRYIHKNDVGNMVMDLMPGLRVTWSYSPSVGSVAEYRHNSISKELTNILQENVDKYHKIWNLVKKTKLKSIEGKNKHETCDTFKTLLQSKYVRSNIDIIVDSLGVNSSYEITSNIKKETYKTAAEMFLYLNFCPDSLYHTPWISFYHDLFKENPNTILQTLNRLTKHPGESIGRNVSLTLWRMTRRLNLTKSLNSNIEDGSLSDQSNEKMVKHPVHIVDEDGKVSPSSFIPFCEFGGNMSMMGDKIDEFDVPVCNSFKAKILYDQLCYEVDLNVILKNYSQKGDMKDTMKLGLTLLVDYNEDRQDEIKDLDKMRNLESITNKLVNVNYHEMLLLHIETLEPLLIYGEGEYNMNEVKEIKVTDAYLGLKQDIIRCQDHVTLTECATIDYIETLLKSCGCLPFNINIMNKVCVSQEEKMCSKNIKPHVESCQKSCEEGIHCP